MNASFEPKEQERSRYSHRNECQSAISSPSRTIVRAKLEMTEPGDHDEQEADAVANTIVSGGKIARKISGGGGSSGIAVSQQMESQLSQLQGGGRQMPDGLRNMMESGFGRDFSQVRLHTNSEAASMSSSIHAKAFTLGNDIYFNQGQFSPTTTEGQRLVAHELTHVVQGGKQVARQTGDPEERKPSQNDYANFYIFNLDGVLSSENSANSPDKEVVVYDGKQIIKTGLSMEQFLYITAVVQHEADSTNYTYEELFAVARSIVNATIEKKGELKTIKEKEGETIVKKNIMIENEFDLVRTGFSSVGVDKKGVDKKMEHIYKYKKDSNAFIGDLKSNKNDKFQTARQATLSVFALKTAPSNGLLDKENLSENYKDASRWDGTDFYINLKRGVIIKKEKVGGKTVTKEVTKPHPKFTQNSVIKIPKNILDSYYKANGNNGELQIFYKNELINGNYYIEGKYHRDALIAVGNAGKSIFWKKKRGVIKKKDKIGYEAAIASAYLGETL